MTFFYVSLNDTALRYTSKGIIYIYCQHLAKECKKKKKKKMGAQVNIKIHFSLEVFSAIFGKDLMQQNLVEAL